jgi:hypothetical protein
MVVMDSIHICIQYDMGFLFFILFWSERRKSLVKKRKDVNLIIRLSNSIYIRKHVFIVTCIKVLGNVRTAIKTDDRHLG